MYVYTSERPKSIVPQKERTEKTRMSSYVAIQHQTEDAFFAATPQHKERTQNEDKQSEIGADGYTDRDREVGRHRWTAFKILPEYRSHLRAIGTSAPVCGEDSDPSPSRLEALCPREKQRRNSWTMKKG